MKPKVLVICGYGRSGSTLLDRVLGRIDGFFSAGEVRHLWREGLVENRLCGCGVAFRDCQVWRDILDRIFGDDLDAQDVLELQARVDRFFRIPQIAVRRPASFRDDMESYARKLERLYEAIAQVSNARVIVDSTKDVSHAWLTTRVRSVDPYMLHLIRDGRATAYSWRRRKFNPGSGRDMDRYGWVTGAMRWNAINALASEIRRTRTTYTRMRYEDFAARPQSAVREILEFLNERTRDLPLGPSGEVELGIDHTVAGNPLRFKKGVIQIRPDDEWRHGMDRRSQLLVGALTWPSRRRYGFGR